MASRGYVRGAADIVWLQFDPQAGHEPAGHRPALVLSPAIYNGKTHLMVCCPLSTKLRGHPLEVPLEVAGQKCAVLSDQVKSLDRKIRKAEKKDTAAAAVMVEVRAKLRALRAIQ